MLRDAEVPVYGREALARLAHEIKDPNFRIFAEDGEVHAVSAGLHLADADPFALFASLAARTDRDIDASHAFYLGYEMAKAVTALTLGKDYRQDEALDWGFLTRPERHRRSDGRGAGRGDPPPTSDAGESTRTRPPRDEDNPARPPRAS